VPRRPTNTHEVSRQEQHEALLRQARERPGVAEVIDLYGRFTKYTLQQGPGVPLVRHSTGGNG
jgi:hypothetical protein